MEINRLKNYQKKFKKQTAQLLPKKKLKEKILKNANKDIAEIHLNI